MMKNAYHSFCLEWLGGLTYIMGLKTLVVTSDSTAHVAHCCYCLKWCSCWLLQCFMCMCQVQGHSVFDMLLRMCVNSCWPRQAETASSESVSTLIIPCKHEMIELDPNVIHVLLPCRFVLLSEDHRSRNSWPGIRQSRAELVVHLD